MHKIQNNQHAKITVCRINNNWYKKTKFYHVIMQ